MRVRAVQRYSRLRAESEQEVIGVLVLTTGDCVLTYRSPQASFRGERVVGFYELGAKFQWDLNFGRGEVVSFAKIRSFIREHKESVKKLIEQHLAVEEGDVLDDFSFVDLVRSFGEP